METQETIALWAEQTFGPNATPQSICVRAMVELVELVQETMAPEASEEKITEECADVWIVLARAAHLMHFDMRQRTNHELWWVVTQTDRTANVCRALNELNMATLALIHGQRGATTHICRCLGMLQKMVGEEKLSAAIEKKMQVNRSRQWKLDGRGHGQHV